MDHFKTFLRLFRLLLIRSEFGTIRFQPLLRKLHCRVQTSRKSGEICWTVETVRRYLLYFWIKEQKASHTDITVTTVDTRILILSIFESFSVEVLIPMLMTQTLGWKNWARPSPLHLKSAIQPFSDIRNANLVKKACRWSLKQDRMQESALLSRELSRPKACRIHLDSIVSLYNEVNSCLANIR
jgi:hypothetical protein